MRSLIENNRIDRPESKATAKLEPLIISRRRSTKSTDCDCKTSSAPLLMTPKSLGFNNEGDKLDMVPFRPAGIGDP